ncbi:unnamed protein product (macronuclear) [Paramecium tetraurelia]|uniref:Chromosome undetermined scaffold_1, whole genome shotgun sequence n=1 Tax=Paramecium tetraurelia TaxID=5888 RepID=Q6BGF6_PARTE|nr:hypothetical protein [Paramecium tetraurelia strain d4-2]XP_001423443.1 uncharacterized protein GSPATT00000480001 [Paramecium tetraurelia]CAH03264.1 hypothetical protein, transmembrane helices [Paramecium tetraurelia]CAK56045.1 unnamed protein product [Paramecium tetraurelia]|eukprot:XP_001423443.1 hypothetical protein (macronuclear) [Paramecium tetraurelia strain d4-2]
MSQQVELGSVFGLNFLLILFTLICYHVLFVRKGIYFPGPEDGSILLIQNSFITIKHNIKLLLAFDKDYYTRVCGIDGYQYLYFIRQLIKLQLVFFLIAFISGIFPDKKTSLIIIDQDFTPSFQFCMTLIYCGILMLFVYNTLEEIKNSEIHSEGEVDIIRQHSIFIKGIREDVTKEDIKNFFNQVFDTLHIKVLSVVIIPKYPIKEVKNQKENELYLQNKHQLLISCFSPKLQEIPQVEPNSGHAIITFDTVEAVNQSLQRFKFEFKSCHKADSDNIEDDRIKISQTYLLAFEAPDPFDVIYLYLNTTLKNLMLRRFFMQILLILVLLFFTTPTSIIEFIGFDNSIGKQEDEGDISVFRQYFSLILVVLINSALLMLIQLSSRWERHISKSQYQIKIFNPCVFYLTMNMLVIPAISFLAVHNVYQIVMQGATNMISAIQAVYFLNNGRFFIGILIQAGCVSLITMLRLDEIFTSYISVQYTELKRKHFKIYPHLQPLGDIFSYGYYYGLQIAVLFIVMTFSTNIPFIHLAGVFYSMCRFYVDSLNLQTVFGQEIKSNNTLIYRVLITSFYTIYPKLLLNLVMFVLEWNTKYTLLTIATFIISVILIVQIQVKLDRFTNQSILADNKINLIMNYNIYQHPLAK